MKKCTYCGKEYPDTAGRCAVDHEPLIDTEPPPPKPEPAWHPKLIDLKTIPAAFEWCEGFSRPNWKVISETIEQNVSAIDRSEAWTEVAIQWAYHIREDLGGLFNVRRSQEFILVSSLDLGGADRLLDFAERTLANIYLSLKEAACKWVEGKHMILLFSEEDDYYQYISYFYPEGNHPASGGCLISDNYAHIAMVSLDGKWLRRPLTHELLHNAVIHLPLPTWLNEGLAQHFDRSADDRDRPVVDHDFKERHLAFWNRENIQKFWAGVSFHEPGESRQLSYNLGEILFNLLITEPSALQAFVQQAHRNDAGQTAALDFLGIDLGQALASFLGEGDWRPRRKAIVECWDALMQKDVTPARIGEPGQAPSREATDRELNQG